MPGPTDTEFFAVAEMEADGKDTAVGAGMHRGMAEPGSGEGDDDG